MWLFCQLKRKQIELFIYRLFIEGFPYTPAQCAYGCSLSLICKILFNKVDELYKIERSSPFESAFYEFLC